MKVEEIPSMTLQDIKETKRYGHTFVRTGGYNKTLRTHFRSDGRTDVKTVYPPTNTVCGRYNYCQASFFYNGPGIMVHL